MANFRGVSDANVSAMQYCPPGLCKNCPVDMNMTVHVFARLSKRECTQATYYAAWIFTHYDCSEYPTAEHFPCHSWHVLSLWKMANVFRRPRAFILQGRFRIHEGIHNSNANYSICKNVLRIVLHRGHNCMRQGHRGQISPPNWCPCPSPISNLHLRLTITKVKC